MSGLLQDRSVVVTGAASGIGSATTRLLLAEGANVLATDIDVKKGESLIRELDTSFPNGSGFCGKTLRWRTRGSRHSMRRYRRSADLTCWSTMPGYCLLSSALLKPAEWRRVMSVNLDGVFFVVKHAFLG